VRGIVRSEHRTHPRAVCRNCGQLIVRVDGIGWLDPDIWDTYDLCPDDPYGNHQPSGRSSS
jgi:hypothetical protein